MSVTVTLDAHGGEREREHGRLWCELQTRIADLVEEGQYDTLNPNYPDHTCGQCVEPSPP